MEPLDQEPTVAQQIITVALRETIGYNEHCFKQVSFSLLSSGPQCCSDGMPTHPGCPLNLQLLVLRESGMGLGVPAGGCAGPGSLQVVLMQLVSGWPML